MANVSTSIDINAPMQDVWDTATDLKWMGEWVSILRDVPTPAARRGHAGHAVYAVQAAGKVGEAAGHVVSGAADREANDSLGRLKALVEA